MKKNRGKILIFLLFTGLSLYFLYPTYKDYSFTKELRSLVGDDSLKYVEQNEEAMRVARLKRVKLGLDLQGGMRVVLEVNVLKYLEDIAKNKDEQFMNVINEVRAESQTSEEEVVDLLGRKLQQKQLRAARYYGSIRDEDDVIIQKLRDETVSAVDRAIEIVRNRIDQYGVSEPSIQKQGGRRIIVELPGVSKEGEVRQLLQGTALLEFKILYDPEIMSKVYQAIDASLAGKPIDDSLNVNKTDTSTTAAANDTTAKPVDTTSTVAQTDTNKPADTSLATLDDQAEKTPEELKKEHPFFAIANPMQQPNQGWSGQLFTIEEDKGKVNRILEKPEIKQLIPSGVSFAWSAKKSFTAEGKNFFALYAVKKEAELTGGVITEARATIDPNFNTPIVTMEMNTEGAREWARITGSNINKQIAIILDNAIFSAPVVRGKITGGNSQIEGMESVEEAKLLEIVLKAGALPAPVDIIQQTSVGPSLGEDSIKQGIYSSLMALLLTIVFMIFYYRMGGTVADVVLFLNMLFMLAILAGFQGTLTLPGIAGIILTMAVAVDANVLIYERIREESATGKTLSAAVDTGYEKAFTAIFDSNLTTFITGVILYQFGSGPVQGFALTLMIGIVISMFTAIVGTRIIFSIMLERGKVINFG
ncbi:MAG: protein translocase subunit SecD [Ignavibacteriae bacterium]|nr:protein translocase subunit SecD [Ignavibacteriota bacterium]